VETSVPAQSTSDRYPKVATPIHTIFVLAALGGWTFLGTIVANYMRTAEDPHRVRFYVLAILTEWLWFVLVVVGVQRSGAPVWLVLGDRWQSVRQVLRDIGVAAAFWIISIVILVAAARLLHTTNVSRNLDFLTPHGRFEIALWIVVAISAGICEETVFRGYLQRQFMALSKSAPAGILLSAVAFGAAHAYQGYLGAILIGLYGAMFGILAHWRRSVRPGMIAHAWQDSLVGVLSALIRH
jgi:membrane protease YdiL (CAAX protease family)